MWFLITATLATAGIAMAAVPPAQATFCSEDNLLRAFQHTPTPASSYCVTSTAYPTFLAITTYPASRLSSACSCFSRFPSETTAAAPCQPTTFTFTSTSSSGPISINVVGTFDRTQACGAGGYKITTLCGLYENQNVNYFPTGYFYGHSDSCYVPTLGVDSTGLDFGAGGSPYNLYASGGNLYVSNYQRSEATQMYPGSFQLVPCGTQISCPARRRTTFS